MDYLHALYIAERQRFALKLVLDAAAKLPGNFVLARWRRTHLEPNRAAAAVVGVHSEHAGAVYQSRRPSRVAAQPSGGSLEKLQHPLQWKTRREGDIGKGP